MSAVRFSCLADLARLPYFRLEAGRLVLAGPELGPSIDCHTHLALGYVRPLQVDLWREWPTTEHYLPAERPIDLSLYLNRSLSLDDRRRLSVDLTWRSVTDGGMRRTHTIPNLRRELHDLAVSHAVLLAIDFPILSRNAETWLAAARGQPDLIVYGSVHPYALRLADRLDRQVALGARGVKVHPAVQMIYPDDRRAMRLYRLCGARQLPVLFHCGPVGIEPAAGRRRSQVRCYERAVAECPETTFVLGHAGALQWEEALALACRYDNVWLELASQSLPVIRTLLERGPVDRVVMGSDWPFYPVATALAKAYLATEGAPAERRRVVHDNAARLLRLAPPPPA